MIPLLLLTQANRALRQATLGTLNSVIVAYGDNITPSAYEVIIVELSTLIRFFTSFTYSLFLSPYFSFLFFLTVSIKCLFNSDSDLHMTALALELCCTLMTDRSSTPNIGSTVRDRVLPQALTLVRSSLLQGHALTVISQSYQ